MRRGGPLCVLLLAVTPLLGPSRWARADEPAPSPAPAPAPAPAPGQEPPVAPPAAPDAAAPRAPAPDAPAPAAPAPTPPPSAPPQNPEQAFAADPSDLESGLRWQDTLWAETNRATVLQTFRKHRDNPGRAKDPVALFLVARAEGDAAARKAMGALLEGSLGRASGDDRGLAAGWAALARSEELAGDLPKALEAWQRRMVLQSDAVGYVRHGWLLALLGRDEEAETAYTKARPLAPGWWPTLSPWAHLKALRGGGALAEALAREAAEKQAGGPEARLFLGVVREHAGNAGGAEEALKEAEERARGDEAATAVLAAAWLRHGDVVLARKALDRLLALCPSHLEGFALEAYLALRRLQLPEARTALARALKADANDRLVLLLQGLHAERTQSYDVALTAYKKLLEADPSQADYALGLARVYATRNKLEQAQAVLTAAVGLHPEDARLLVQLGGVLMRRGRWKDARDVLERAIARDPKDPDPHFLRAIVLGDHLNDLEGALGHLRQYQSLGGEDAAALEWLETLEGSVGSK